MVNNLDFPYLRSFNVNGKRLLTRLDLNVPVDEDGKITNDVRLRASLPTIKRALENNAKLILISHFGRPEKGVGYQAKFSLKAVAKWLEIQLNQPVPLIQDWLNATHEIDVKEGGVVLLENLRFYDGEITNDHAMAESLAAMADIYLFDAFGVAHRAAASTDTVIRIANQACFGPLMEQELQNVYNIISNPRHPMITICGGTKVSDKLLLMANLAKISDKVFVGGAMANTFFKANGNEIGNSLYEESMLEQATKILSSNTLVLPEYVVIAPSIEQSKHASIVRYDDVPSDQMILDIAPRSFLPYQDEIKRAGTVIWNGPLGVFEKGFSQGSAKVLQLLNESSGYTVAGGGDTNSLLSMLSEGEINLSYISTGGGAFLAALEGESLPSVNAIMARRS